MFQVGSITRFVFRVAAFISFASLDREAFDPCLAAAVFARVYQVLEITMA